MPTHSHYEGGPAAQAFNATAQPYHVMIATPTSRGFPTQYMMSIVATIEALARWGVKFDFHVLDGDCHVDDARNKIFREFLCTPCTDLLFIDSDMGWQPQNIFKLLNHPSDIAAGIYRHKNDRESYPYHAGREAQHPDDDGWVSAPKLPTGFMRIRRKVIEALHANEVSKNRYFWDNPEDEATGKPGIAAICERAFAHELKLSVDAGDHSDRHSGDLVLCLKARHLGFTCAANLDMTFDHVGEKAWTGNLGVFLRRQQKVDSGEFMWAVDRIRNGHTEIGDFENLYRAFGVVEWPMQGRALHELFHLVRRSEGDVLETGSGLSTIVLGLAVQGTQRHVHSLEHDVLYWHESVAWLRRYGLDNVTLHLAPLLPYQEGFNWYGIDPAQLPEAFGVALIDGPPHKYGRDGVFKVLGGQLKDAVLVIDDAARERFTLDSHDMEMRVGNGRTYAVASPKVAAQSSAA